MAKKFNAENVIVKLTTCLDHVGNGWSMINVKYIDRDTNTVVLENFEMINVLDRWKNAWAFCEYRNHNYETMCRDDWYFNEQFKKLENLTYEV